MSVIYIGDFLMKKVEHYRQLMDHNLSMAEKFQKENKDKFAALSLTAAKKYANLRKSMQMRANRHFSITANAYRFNSEYNGFPEYVKIAEKMKNAIVTINEA